MMHQKKESWKNIFLLVVVVLFFMAFSSASMTRENKIPYSEMIVFSGSDLGHFWFVSVDGDDYSFWRESSGKFERQTTVHRDLRSAFWGLKEETR